MTEGVSQEQFYKALGALEERLGRRFDGIERKIDDHAADDRLVANRVLVIETQRDEEQKAAVRRGTLGGILAAAGVSGMWELVKHVWK